MRRKILVRARRLGLIIIVLYWLSPPFVARLRGVWVSEAFWYTYTWLWSRAQVLLWSLLTPEDELFPTWWMILLGMAIPMALTGVLWWVGIGTWLQCMDRVRAEKGRIQEQ